LNAFHIYKWRKKITNFVAFRVLTSLKNEYQNCPDMLIASNHNMIR